MFINVPIQEPDGQLQKTPQHRNTNNNNNTSN
jgi:hypothetical protein